MKKFHSLILCSALAGAGLGHASSGTNYISSTVDTVVKVMNTSTSGKGTALSAWTGRTNGVAIEATAASSASTQWLMGVRGNAENTGGNYVFGVGTFGSANGAQDGDVAHGVYGQATNAYMENWGVKGVANAQGGNRAVGGQFVSEGGVSHNWGVDAQGQGGYDAYGVTATGYSASNDNYGVKATATGGYMTYGVRGTASGATQDNYGVWGEGDGGYNSIGVFGTASGSGNDKAAVFIGDVLVTGTCTCWPSDEKLKKNVRPLEKGLSTVMALKPKAYDMKVDEYKGKLALAKGPQMGVIAQEAEKVVPEAVRPVHIPGRTVTKNGKTEKIEAIDYKTVDYVALVPVLIKAIQEQQAKIEALEARAK
jgi:hypothetical protein